MGVTERRVDWKGTEGGTDVVPAHRNYTALSRRFGMDRQQIIALLFAFLMVSSMIAWGVSFL